MTTPASFVSLVTQVSTSGIQTEKLSQAAVREVGAVEDMTRACAEELPDATPTQSE